MLFDPEQATVIRLDDELPEYPTFDPQYRRAPRRESKLTEADKALAIKNALRYIPKQHHAQMAIEFAQELKEHGRIYGYRFRPQGKLYGKPIDEYEGKCIEGRAIQVMIDNNLDFDVALYPYELVTYGETGQVCQNWMQYRLIKKYLQVLTDEQTLVVMSGHPLGLFHSHKLAPRVIISNGLMIGNFDDQENFNRAAALGVANYGQMTAGGWMYIGPQGIVHGTFNTLLNAGRLKLGIPNDGNLSGRLFISAGLGGMSGAQGKAAEIAGAAAIIAEVDDSRIDTRYTQGWVSHRTASLEEAVRIAREHQTAGTPCAVAYNGNIVDLLEYLYEKKIHVDLMSDQTSCHVPYDGGYCPQGLTFAQRTEMLDKDREGFRKLVDKTLRHHYEMICKFHEQGTYFFDYGNSFLKAVYDAGVKSVCRNGENDLDGFVFPSYVEDILGPCLFDFGYGPFRWCCLSRNPEDLDKTEANREVIKNFLHDVMQGKASEKTPSYFDGDIYIQHNTGIADGLSDLGAALAGEYGQGAAPQRDGDALVLGDHAQQRQARRVDGVVDVAAQRLEQFAPHAVDHQVQPSVRVIAQLHHGPLRVAQACGIGRRDHHRAVRRAGREPEGVAQPRAGVNETIVEPAPHLVEQPFHLARADILVQPDRRGQQIQPVAARMPHRSLLERRARENDVGEVHQRAVAHAERQVQIPQTHIAVEAQRPVSHLGERRADERGE